MILNIPFNTKTQQYENNNNCDCGNRNVFIVACSTYAVYMGTCIL